MAEPVREQVLSKIVEKLRGMTGIRPWGGQYEAPPVVTRQWIPVGPQVPEFPHLIVSAGSGSSLPIRGIGSGQAVFEHNFRVVIYGYVRGDDGTPAQTWLQRLQDDVIDTLLRNQRLDAVAQELTIEDDETDDGALEPLAGFAQTVLIIVPESRAIE